MSNVVRNSEGITIKKKVFISISVKAGNPECSVVVCLLRVTHLLAASLHEPVGGLLFMSLGCVAVCVCISVCVTVKVSPSSPQS